MRQRARETGRMVLRPYRAGDYPAWRLAWTERPAPPDRWTLGPLPRGQVTRARFDAMRTRHARRARADQLYVYGAFARADGALVGVVDLFVICRGAYQLANLGYQVHPRFRGQGYGKEAARAGLAIGFEDLGLHRIECSIDPDHAASIALATAVGMPREGLRKRYLFEDGRWVDQVLFVATPEDLGLRSRPPPA